MKKLIMVLLALFCSVAHAGPIANIEYIHALIKQRHGIDIEYSPELKSEKLAANMKYLLTLVDIANTRINRAKFTHYGENETYATLNAADTDTVITAVDDLIVKIEYPFHFTPAVESNEYMFQIGALGTYYVDWGDGNVERVVITELPTVVDGNGKTQPTFAKITHTYDTAAKNYTIGLGGRATGYPTYMGSITFKDVASRLSSIDGCLGCVFPTLDKTVTRNWQTTFSETFRNNSQLAGEIPSNLFDNVYGKLKAKEMFYFTFAGCSKLTGQIPENLFAGLTGNVEISTFYATFLGCKGLTGSIPEKLFAGMSGYTTVQSFCFTFRDCSGLTGEIPEKLFAGIDRVQGYANNFCGTFAGASGLTGSIPAGLFSHIKGRPIARLFDGTFNGCTGLTGQIPENLFAGISGAPAASMFASTFSNTGITEIPENLFAGISGAPAASMFASTFSNTGITEIPGNLFAGIQGAPAASMFSGTFSNTGITEIPENLFSGIDDTAESAAGMFNETFYSCKNLTGPSARINGKYLYEIWPEYVYRFNNDGTPFIHNSNTYTYDTGLDDWAQMPAFWK